MSVTDPHIRMLDKQSRYAVSEFLEIILKEKKLETNSKLTLCPCTCFDLRLKEGEKLREERDGNLDN